MELFFTVLVGLVILLMFLHVSFPYFVQDCLFLLTVHGMRSKAMKYAKKNYTILDCFLDRVKNQPEKQFIIFEGKIYSYLEMDKQSNKTARALMTHAHLRAGDTVALFLGNEPYFVKTWLGLAKIGCVSALLNYNIRSKSLLHCLSCCDAKALIASEELKDAVEEVLPSLQEWGISVFLLAAECNTAGIEALTDEISNASDEPLSPDLRSSVTLKSPALYIYTSGTTGLPKAVILPQQKIWRSCLHLGMMGGTSNDVIYVNLPLHHTSAFLLGLCGGIEKGITVVLKRKFSASQFWGDCRKYNVTVIQYIGETMRYLCNTPKKIDDRDHKVRLAVGNGIRGDVWREFTNRFGNIKILELYGATEGNVSFINYVRKIGAVGRVNFIHRNIFSIALIKYDMEREEPVRNSHGLCIEVSKGETGLLVSKISDWAPFFGYANNPQETERKRLRNVFQKGDLYFNSGDLLMIDRDNFVYFQDRAGDTFRWKGENVATTEVSDVLTTMDCVKEANVYGVHMPGNEGRIGMAGVILRDGRQFDCSGMFRHVENYLPAYAWPYFIRIQNSLMITGTFKHIKVKLVQEGFNPALIQDLLYFLDKEQRSYVPLTPDIYNSIVSGNGKSHRTQKAPC